jgi:glutamyl-tRNA synthetase
MSDVRVRVAPSPTGVPHVGTAYIALFNYAFAQQEGGSFVLRIEDTDQARSTGESEEAILRSLRWLGIEWDEGPDCGGPHAPYRQSERAETYREHAQQLLDSGHAYRCFCTPERLAELRNEQKRQRLPQLKYDRRCLELSDDEVAQRLADGAPHVVRLRVPEGETVYHDRLRGEITFQNETIDDQVLLKSDGFPTYHLANVVDDHRMGISHVVRAEEWITSTPKHVLLYEAFGWEPPEFVHMPLLRNKDRSKISKRKNPVSLDWYREQGYLPEALRNFLALLGFSMPDEREVFSLDEFIDAFTWDRVRTSGPVFDLEKLDWLNGVYIREMEAEALAERLAEAVPTAAQADRDVLLQIIPLIRERIKTLSDFDQWAGFFFAERLDYEPDLLVAKKSSREEALAVLQAAEETLAVVDSWDAESLETAVRTLPDKVGCKGRPVFMGLRVAVTGSTASPPLFESMDILGREKSLTFIRQAIERLRA